MNIQRKFKKINKCNLLKKAKKAKSTQSVFHDLQDNTNDIILNSLRNYSLENYTKLLKCEGKFTVLQAVFSNACNCKQNLK